MTLFFNMTYALRCLKSCPVGLQAVFGVGHEASQMVTEGQNRSLQPPEIFRALTDPQIGFPALPLLPSLATESARDNAARIAAAFE